MADESNSTISVTLRAVISELIGPMKQAGEAVQASTQQMTSSFEKLGHTFESLVKGFGAITAVLAGGAMFKHAVDDAVKWNSEVGKMASRLGVTTGEASVLKVALHSLGLEQDVYIGAATKLVRQLNSGGKAVELLGNSAYDANGKIKPMPQLMEAAITKIGGMEQGYSQMAAAQQLFGRGGAESMALLRLTTERMEEAKKEAKELNLEVGPEGVAKTRQYQESMRKLGLIQESLQIQVGNALMPTLQSLGTWLGRTGPAMAEGLAYAIKGIATVFFVLKAVIEVVVTVATTLLMTLWNIVSSIASAIVKVLEGDYKGAWQTLKDGGQDMMNWIEAGADNMGESIKNAISDSAKMWENGKPKDGRVGKSGDETLSPDDGAGDDAMLKKWEANLQAWEAAKTKESLLAGKFHEKDLAAELAYWTEISKFPDLSAKEKTAVRMKMSALEMELAKKELEEKKAALDAEISNEKVNLQRKLELVKQEMGMYDVGTRGYEKSRKRVLEVEREIQEELNALKRQSAAFERDIMLKGLEGEIANLAFRREMGQVSIDEELEAQRSFEARRLSIAQAAIDEELTQKNLTKEKIAELNNKRFMLEVDYHEKLKVLGNKAAMDQKNAIQNALGPLNAGIEKSLQGLLSGTMRWSEAFKNIWKSLGATVDKFLSDMAMNYLKKKQAEVGIEWWASVQKVAAASWGAIKSVALSAWQAIMTIGHRAWEAAAAAYASISEIPMVGPFLAPAVAAGLLAAVIGMGSHIASAAGGWHTVPNDQLAMIHKDEQVLPAKYAEGLRNLIEGGGAQGGGFSPTFHINALDAKGVERVLRDNNSAVGKAVRDYGRNFGGMK